MNQTLVHAGLPVSPTNPLPVTDIAIGAAADTAATTDTGTFSLIALFKRLLSKLTAFGNTAATALNVASFDGTVSLTPTIDGAVYTAGDSIGGKLVLASAVAVAGGASFLHSLVMTDKANTKPTGRIYFFDADPTAATITNNAAFAWSTDVPKVVGSVLVEAADWITLDSNATYSKANIGLKMKSAATTSLWAAFVTDGAPDFAANGDLKIHLGFLPVNA